MSRPKGSLNKKTIKKIEKLKKVEVKKYKKRGRPKGSKKVPVEKVVYDMSKVKRFKFLGYCKCHTLISNNELVSKFIYVCPGCGKRNRLKKLSKVLLNDQPKSRKEFYSNVPKGSSFESLPLNDHQLGPKDLKIQD